MSSKTIGIVAVSPEGAALLFRDLHHEARRVCAGNPIPTVVMHALPLADYIRAAEARDWHAVADMLLESSRALHAAGAEFCITPDHIVQHALHLMQGTSPLPWLSMSELVAKRLEKDGVKDVGVLGTREAMYGSTYQTILGMKGIKVRAPDEQDADTIQGIVFEELIYGIFSGSTIERVSAIADRLIERGAEALLVASSELPLVLNQSNCQHPVYDAGRLLAEGAAHHAVASTIS